jgi:hypothetical protein
MHVEVGGHLLVDLDQELLELDGPMARWRWRRLPMTLPLAMSSAANRLVVPWRT